MNVQSKLDGATGVSSPPAQADGSLHDAGPAHGSLPRRLLSKVLGRVRALGIPHFEAFETRSRQAVRAASATFKRHLTPTRFALERLERKVDALDRKVAEAGANAFHALDLIGRTKAGVDSLRWRNVFQLAPDILVVRNPDGYLCIPAEDHRLIGHLADGVLDEPGTTRVVQTLLKPGATFLDIGANVGMFTLMAARLVGPSGKVIALEPIPRLAALLRKTIVMDDIERVVELHEVAASDSATTRTLNLGYPYALSSLYDLPGSHGAVDVACVPIDDLLGPNRKVDLIKIDVEGAELAVLRGMKRTLANNPQAVVIVEFGTSHLRRAGVAVDDWMRELRSYERDIWEIDDRQQCLRRPQPVKLEVDHSVNLALVRGRPELLQGLTRDDPP